MVRSILFVGLILTTVLGCGVNSSKNKHRNNVEANIPRPPVDNIISNQYPNDLIPISVKPDPARDTSLEPTSNREDSFHMQIDKAVSSEQGISKIKVNLPKCSGLSSFTSDFGCSIFIKNESKNVHAADVKIYLADTKKATLNKVAFLFAPHRFSLPKTINQEAQFLTNRPNARYLFNALNLKGVSIVFVSFAAEDVFKESIMLKSLGGAEVIRKVNKLKYDSSPSLLMGFSLGGVIGRLSLLELESNGQDLHGISGFISYDSPHRGAHVPVGLQNLIPFLSKGVNGARRSFSDIKKKLKYLKWLDDIINVLSKHFEKDVNVELDFSDYENLVETHLDKATKIANVIDVYNDTLLESVASQELLIQQNLKVKNNFVNNKYIQIQNYLNKNGMPQFTTRNIGVANGSIDGRVIPIASESYASIDSDLINHFELDFNIGVAKQSSSVFEGFFVYPHWKALKELPWDKAKHKYDHHYVIEPILEDSDALLDLDVAPCAYIDIEEGLKSRMSEGLGAMLESDVIIDNPYACFIHSTSSLASTLPIDSKEPITSENSLFDEIIGSQQNSSHMEFTNTITNRLIDIVLESY